MTQKTGAKPPRHLGTVQSRREFLRGCARWTAAAALAAVAVRVLGRQPRAHPPGIQRCVNRGICRGCREYPRCGLPQALSRRRARRGAANAAVSGANRDGGA